MSANRFLAVRAARGYQAWKAGEDLKAVEKIIKERQRLIDSLVLKPDDFPIASYFSQAKHRMHANSLSL